MSLLIWLNKSVGNNNILPSPSRRSEFKIPSSYMNDANKDTSTPNAGKQKH